VRQQGERESQDVVGQSLVLGDVTEGTQNVRGAQKRREQGSAAGKKARGRRRVIAMGSYWRTGGGKKERGLGVGKKKSLKTSRKTHLFKVVRGLHDARFFHDENTRRL